MTSSTTRALVAKKQNLLFNQLTAMPKRLAMVLTVLFTLGVGSMCGETVTLASWTFTSSKYPSNKTAFNANGGTCTGSTFYLNGSGSTWNTSAGKGYAFTAVTDITITVKLANPIPAGTAITFAADMFYNKASNAPMTGFSISVSENGGAYGTHGLDVSSITLSNSSQNKAIVYTTQSALDKDATIAMKYTQTGKAGAGQGYFNNISITSEQTAVTPSHTITAQSNNTSYGTVSLSGTTITASPKTGYRVSTSNPYSISPSGSATVSQNGDAFTVTPTANTTITINFEAIPTYTVNWYVNGTVKHTQTATAGTTLTNIPTPTTADCDNSKVFVGWTTESSYSNATTAPSGMITNTSGMTMPEGGKDYYAVFATESTIGSGSAGWGKVTSTADLKAGDIYAISSAATGGTYLSTYTGGNNYPASSTIICKLELGGSSGAWTFKIADGSTYNNYYLTATSTTGSNYLKAVSPADNYSKFTISFSSNAAVITCAGKDSRNILRYNGSNNPPIFSCYSSEQSAVYLQKYSAGSTTTYSDYITTCTTETSRWVIKI